MREIKFRAWDKKYTSMHPFEQMQIRNVFCLNEGLAPEQFIILPKHENIVLQQYTGLKDKNGKEIYEGDIGKVMHGDPFAPEVIVSVVFENGSFGVYPTNNQTDLFGNKYTGKMLPFSDGYDERNFEIIGNIYEHPHLITASEVNARLNS